MQSYTKNKIKKINKNIKIKHKKKKIKNHFCSLVLQHGAGWYKQPNPCGTGTSPLMTFAVARTHPACDQ